MKFDIGLLGYNQTFQRYTIDTASRSEDNSEVISPDIEKEEWITTCRILKRSSKVLVFNRS